MIKTWLLAHPTADAFIQVAVIALAGVIIAGAVLAAFWALLYVVRFGVHAKPFVKAELPSMMRGKLGILEIEFVPKERKAIAELSKYLETTQGDILILKRAVVALKEQLDQTKGVPSK